MKDVPTASLLPSQGGDGHGHRERRQPARLRRHRQRADAAVREPNLEQRPRRHGTPPRLRSGIRSCSDTPTRRRFLLLHDVLTSQRLLLERREAWKEDGSDGGMERRKCGGTAGVCSCKGDGIFHVSFFLR